MHLIHRWLLFPLCVAIGGCAVRTFEIKVAPEPVVDAIMVRVVDGRMDKHLYMNAIAFGGQTSLYPLAPVPPMEEALRAYIQVAASTRGYRRLVGDTLITVDEIDIKNRVGFASPDEMSCRMESTLRVGTTDSSIERRVRSFTQNQQNLSPFIQTSAEVIVRQCLAQHAIEVLNALRAASGG